MSSPISMEDVTVPAKDGFALAATVYTPQQGNNKVIIINSAVAVNRQFYQHFARFLCQQGFVVLTYDYRGIGGSAPESAAQKDMAMQHWGELDLVGCLNWLQHAYPGFSIYCVAHSVGAQIIGLAENNGIIESVVSISGQSGYWRHWHFSRWPKLLTAWYLLVPCCATLLGYVPGAFIGGHPLPKGIASQWARWCRNPHYISTKSGDKWRPYFSQMRKPFHFYAISDDLDFAPKKAVESLAADYSHAQKAIETIEPSSYGLKRMGHFGFFKSSMPEQLWLKVANHFYKKQA